MTAHDGRARPDLESVRNADRLFRRVLFAAGSVLTACLLLIAYGIGVGTAERLWPSTWTETMALAGWGGVLLLVAGGFVLALYFLLRDLVRLRALCRHLPTESVARHRVVEAAREIMTDTDRVELPSLRVVRSPLRIVFTYGWLRPTVIVSTALIDHLEPGELRAVLRHEAHHARRLDPLRLTVAGFAVGVVGFLPMVRDLYARMREAIEIAADDGAILDNPANRLDLAAALTKLARDPWGSTPRSHSHSLCAGLSESDGEMVLRRIRRLVGEPVRGPGRSRLRSRLVSTGFCVALVGTAAASGQGIPDDPAVASSTLDPAFAVHQDGESLVESEEVNVPESESEEVNVSEAESRPSRGRGPRHCREEGAHPRHGAAWCAERGYLEVEDAPRDVEEDEVGSSRKGRSRRGSGRRGS